MQYILAVLIAILIYLLQMILYGRFWDENLTVSISYSKTYADVGDTIELLEQIENRKPLPLPILYVKFCSSITFQYEAAENVSLSDHYYRNDIFSVLGNQQITRTQTFRTTKRGCYIIDSINLVSSDLFMRNRYAAVADNHAVLYVYPKQLTDRQSLSLTSSIIGNVTRRTLYEDPLSFRGIRDYTSQDSMRYINWKATAKNQQLMVNTYFDTQNSEVILLLNVDTQTIKRSEPLQEYLICIAATLLRQFTRLGLASRLAVNLADSNTDRPVISDLGIGQEHLQKLLQILALLNLSEEPMDFLSFFDGSNSLFSHRENSTAYVIISNYRRDDLLMQYRSKKQSGYQLHFICPEEKGLAPALPDVTPWEVNINELQFNHN
ncbi:MAG: DUF58 domain-containing protein [Lachnospiraceae bacterium]|nr:DUF58 domain-containing protein [Lachnospiraceae bacterium]MDE6627171.1 DUF58 domain-containing protein [Lachnospiraceae bacterium]